MNGTYCPAGLHLSLMKCEMVWFLSHLQPTDQLHLENRVMKSNVTECYIATSKFPSFWLTVANYFSHLGQFIVLLGEKSTGSPKSKFLAFHSSS